MGRDTRSSERRAWETMLGRCTNPDDKDYHRYGERGIKVCARWEGSFDKFMTDMGSKPTARHTLDRKNNDGNYEPGNCRWATLAQQAQNRSTTVLSPTAVILMRYMYRRSHNYNALGRAFGVSGHTARFVCKRRIWRNAWNDLLLSGQVQQGCCPPAD